MYCLNSVDLIGAFEDSDIIHVDDSVDPVRDLETISAELRLKVRLVPQLLSGFICCMSLNILRLLLNFHPC